jgi:hypothetical protein
MTDAGLKKILGFLLRNKDMVSSLLGNFKPEDVERGILALPENLVNRDFKMMIMDQAGPYLNDYALSFNQGSVFLDVDADAKQLGRIKAKYMLTVSRFDFQEEIHKISFTYREDVKSEGNFVQSMALKAAGLKGSILQTAADFAKLDFLDVTKEEITIDMDQLEAAKKIPPALKLEYLSSEDGILKLRFYI